MYHFDWIKRHAERTPNKLAVVDVHTGRAFTYVEFNARANRLANFFEKEWDIQQGDRVAILAKNSSDYFEVLFACAKIGAILNTLNWRLAVPELEYILNDCSPSILIYEPDFAETVEELKSRVGIQFYLWLGEEGQEAWNYERALASGSDVPVDSPRLKYDDTWAILYTSGTTGRPKGAQVTYGNFFYNAIGVGQSIDLNSQDVNLVILPTFHAGGLGLYACPTFHFGGTVVVMREVDLGNILGLIQDWKVTNLIMVPSIYLMLAQFEDFDAYDLSSVKHWTSGGAALPPNLVERFQKRGILIRQGFGMTETGPTVFMIPEDAAVEKAGSIGKPVLHTDVCIMDKAHNLLGPNEVGELCIRGGNVTSGYWNQPEATQETIADGWLHSGDAAKYDKDGFYYIVDRWKDMFISGGENVYPAEIENVLYQLPQIAEVAVIGIADPKWQEVGRAVVVLKEGQSLTEKEVIKHCGGKLANYKIPKSVLFVESIPHNATGKILKNELRQQYGS